MLFGSGTPMQITSICHHQGIFFWTLFCLTLHSFSKGILVNLWNTKVWLLWNFNRVKYFFETGDSKMKAEQAPLPTQTIFFFFAFSNVSAAGCYWNFEKSFQCLKYDTNKGLFHFSFSKMRKTSKLLKAIKRNMKSKTRTILMLLILQCQCEKETGKKGESLSLCVYLEFVRFHIWRFFFCERSWFAIIANFLWNTNFNFQMVLRKVCLVFRKKESLLHMQWNGFWCLKNPTFGQFS